MSIHQNADGSQTEGMKIEGNGQFVSHSFLTVSAAVAINAAAVTAAGLGAHQAVINNASPTLFLYYTLDGSTPSATNGVLVMPGQSVSLTISDALNTKLFGSASMPVVVTYTM